MSEQTHNQLSPKHLEIIQALAAGATISHAADAAGIHRSSVYNWVRNVPQFRAALTTAKAIHAETLQDGLRGISSSAVKVLSGILENEQLAASVRLRAALAVIKSVEAQGEVKEVKRPNVIDRYVAAAHRASVIDDLRSNRHNSTQFDRIRHFHANRGRVEGSPP